MNKSPIDMAIVISSCDAYSDAWEPFFKLFFKYWPDCPYPLYLVTNTKIYPDKRVKSITVPEYGDWGRKLKLALNKIPYEDILYLQEDYFLKRKVITDEILHFVEIMRTENASYLRLYPSPRPTGSFKNYSDIGLSEAETEYRTSLQAALWKKDFFRSLLSDKEETAINFEKRTSARSKNDKELFLCVKEAVFYYLATGILKGKWDRRVIRLFKKENITADFSKRPFEPYGDYIQHLFISTPFIGKFFRFVFRLYYAVKMRIVSSTK